jgi:hypothetical protein
LDSEQSFTEFDISNNGLLTIRNYREEVGTTLAQTDQWVIELIDRKHYLKIPLYNFLYEIITINHTVLVMLDNNSHDKIFLIKEIHWSSVLQSNTALRL